MKEDLKPCPFCGVKLIHASRLGYAGGWIHHTDSEESRNCILRGTHIYLETAEAWNRRA